MHPSSEPQIDLRVRLKSIAAQLDELRQLILLVDDQVNDLRKYMKEQK